MNGSLRLISGTAAVVVTSALAGYVWVELRFSPEWNWLFILGLPLLFTYFFFRRNSWWLCGAVFVWLTICSFIAFLSTAQTLGVGE